MNYYNENNLLIINPPNNIRGPELKLINPITEKITKVSGKKYYASFGFRNNVSLMDGWDSYFIEDINGNILLQDIYQAYPVYSNDRIAVILENGKSGFVNQNGEFVIETSFYINPDDLGPKKYPILKYFFKHDYALVKNEDKRWVQFKIDGTKTPFPENIEPVAYCYENGLVPIINLETKKYGYMNPDFEIVIPCNFSYANSFVEGYAIVKYEDKDAIVDVNGNIYFTDDLLKDN